MARVPSPLAPHPPLARNDQPTSTSPEPAATPKTDEALTAPAVPAPGSERPCHLPIAWAARPGLDHPRDVSA